MLHESAQLALKFLLLYCSPLLPLKFLPFFFESQALFFWSLLSLPHSSNSDSFCTFLLSQPRTTSSPPSTRRSRLTCATTRGDTTTSPTRCTPCMGKWPFFFLSGFLDVTIWKNDSEDAGWTDLKPSDLFDANLSFPLSYYCSTEAVFLLCLRVYVSRRWWERTVRQVQYQKQMTTCWLPKWIINASTFPLRSPRFWYSLIIALLFLGSKHLGTKHSDAVRSQREVWSYWDANWENLSEESKTNLLFLRSWGATEQGTLQMELPAMNVCQLWWAHRSPTEVNLDLLQQYSKYYVIPDKQYSIVTSSSHFIPFSETIFNILDIFKHMIQLDCLIAVTLQTWRFPWNMNYAPHYAQCHFWRICHVSFWLSSVLVH